MSRRTHPSRALALLALGAFAIVAFTALPAPGEKLDTPFSVFIGDPQHHCLPWQVFLGYRRPPVEIRPGMLVTITANNLEPILPQGSRLVKMVAGLPGDLVEARGGAVYINGHRWGAIKYPQLRRTPDSYQIPEGQVLLMGVTDESYDGRYWGPTPIERIDGSAVPALARIWDTDYYSPHVESNIEFVRARRDQSVGAGRG